MSVKKDNLYLQNLVLSVISEDIDATDMSSADLESFVRNYVREGWKELLTMNLGAAGDFNNYKENFLDSIRDILNKLEEDGESAEVEINPANPTNGPTILQSTPATGGSDQTSY